MFDGLPDADDTLLSTLVQALDAVDHGTLVLDRSLRVCFANRLMQDLCGLEPGFLAERPTLRQTIERAVTSNRVSPGEADPASYAAARETAVSAGCPRIGEMRASDGRRFLVRCAATPDGGRVLTYLPLAELGTAADEAADKAEMKLDREGLESQAAYLAALAEWAERAAQEAEEARRIVEAQMTARMEMQEQLRVAATTDALTGAKNRATILTLGDRELDRTRRLRQGLAVLLLDLDHFKAVNDRFGHAAGDEALRHVVRAIASSTRQIDVVGRLGGEEFAVLLPAIGLDPALRVADRIRASVASNPVLTGGSSIRLTLSIGVAMANPEDRAIEGVIARADRALFAAKQAGRNRVISATIDA